MHGGGATRAFIGSTAWHRVAGLGRGLGHEGEVDKLEAGLGVSMDLMGLLFHCGEAMPPHNVLGAGSGRGAACAILSSHLHAHRQCPVRETGLLTRGRQEDTRQGAVALSKRKYLLNKTKVFSALL